MLNIFGRKKTKKQHEDSAVSEAVGIIVCLVEDGNLKIEDEYIFLDGFMAGYVAAVYKNNLVK